MTHVQPTTHYDGRFSSPDAEATPWARVEETLTRAEIYWLSTVRPDGRPHVAPLIGLWHEEAFHFTTGPDEQKRHNLAASPLVAVTTGVNTWEAGLDVVVEGSAVRVTEQEQLAAASEAYVAKYGEVWRFEVGDGAFSAEGGGVSHLYRVAPDKVLSFAKDPHAQTRYTFSQP